MFNFKKIKELEEKVSALRKDIMDLESKVAEFCKKVDALVESREKSKPTPEVEAGMEIAPAPVKGRPVARKNEQASSAGPKPKRQRRNPKPANNGKEGNETAE